MLSPQTGREQKLLHMFSHTQEICGYLSAEIFTLQARAYNLSSPMCICQKKLSKQGCVTVAEVPQRRQKIQSKRKQGNRRKVAWRDVRPKFRKARAKSFPKK